MIDQEKVISAVNILKDAIENNPTIPQYVKDAFKNFDDADPVKALSFSNIFIRYFRMKLEEIQGESK